MQQKVCRVSKNLSPSVVDHLIYFQGGDRYVDVFIFNGYIRVAKDWILFDVASEFNFFSCVSEGEKKSVPAALT